VYTALFSATAAGIMVFSMNLKLPHKNRVEKILLLFNFFAIFFFMRYLLIELNGIPFYSMFAFYLVILIYLFGKFILYLSRNADK
jgi:Ca2+/Na+ antiporter